LIGFCFSDPPKEKGFSFVKQADTLRDLMVNVLGYEKFGAQGGDWGGIICTPLGYKYPGNLIGMHLHYMGVMIRQEAEPDPDVIRGFGLEGAPIRPIDPDTKRFWKTFEQWCLEDGGYRHIQMTRPQSLAYGLSDSPVGLAGWFIEKYRSWSDCHGDVEKVFTKDYLITNVMLYWVTNSISTAIRIYYESQHHQWKLMPGDQVTVPTGFAAFPKEHTPIIRSRAEQYFNVQRFTDMPRGGHFASWEEPELLVGEIRAFFRWLRD
jgi:pimeloyl-ACP methyl ester carboxylesterase